jgi:hypothetical protein
MSDDTLLNHARRYFTLAGQASDVRKMRMLAELGLEYLRLLQDGERAPTRAGAPTESAATPARTPDQGGTSQADN